MVARKQGSCEDSRESCTRKETRLRPPPIAASPLAARPLAAHFTRHNNLVPTFSLLLVE